MNARDKAAEVLEAHMPTFDWTAYGNETTVTCTCDIVVAITPGHSYDMHLVTRHWADALDAAGLLAADPETITTAENLVETRAGLALANAAWQEGAATMLKSVNQHRSGVWVKPVSPYSAALLARIKTENGKDES